MTAAVFRSPLIVAIISLFVCGWPFESKAWGRLGHAVVCEIAYSRLSPAAKNEVDRIIRDDPEFDRFAESCSWADSPRKRGTEHYVNFQRRGPVSTARPEGRQNVVRAIEQDLRRLRDLSAPAQERLESLKFLAHWVGDVHQPLHASFRDDRGANTIRVSGDCRGSLHGAWDGCLIERYVRRPSARSARPIAEKRSPRPAPKRVGAVATRHPLLRPRERLPHAH
ncbi:MAG: S1/P1 nuclease, partial [Myxococcota bacterium]